MADDEKPWITADGVRVGPGDRAWMIRYGMVEWRVEPITLGVDVPLFDLGMIYDNPDLAWARLREDAFQSDYA